MVDISQWILPLVVCLLWTTHDKTKYEVIYTSCMVYFTCINKAPFSCVCKAVSSSIINRKSHIIDWMCGMRFDSDD